MLIFWQKFSVKIPPDVFELNEPRMSGILPMENSKKDAFLAE